jgi:catechol 2,3-dioxygenase-like lactoylglutathione lyase family enzyme
MSKAINIDHIALVAKDIDQSIAFYKKAFGFELLSTEDIVPLGMKNAILKLEGDGCILEIVQFTDGRDFNYADGYYELLSIRVEDIVATANDLADQGIELLEKEHLDLGGEGYFNFLRGPSGEKIELIQRK